MFQMICN